MQFGLQPLAMALLGCLLGALGTAVGLSLAQDSGIAARPAKLLLGAAAGVIAALSLGSHDAHLGDAVLATFLIALAAADLENYLLPDLLTLPLLMLGLAGAALAPHEVMLDRLIGAALGAVILFALAWAYRRIRGFEGLGGGDIKLFAAGGAWIGALALGSALLIAALAALAATLGLSLLRRRKPLRTDRLPFGAFLCLGIWAVWLHGPLSLSP